MDIAPIPTTHNGITFRSRTEARWAVFFDQLGIAYRYEQEGFELPGGRYLPDFFLPGVNDGMFVEIKGIAPTADEYRACEELAKASTRPVLIVYGSPPESGAELDSLNRNFVLFDAQGEDVPHLFCECPKCGRVGVEWSGYGDRVCDRAGGRECCGEKDAKTATAFGPRFVAAAREANRRRFWN
jgi:hypothetical protein